MPWSLVLSLGDFAAVRNNFFGTIIRILRQLESHTRTNNTEEEMGNEGWQFWHENHNRSSLHHRCKHQTVGKLRGNQLKGHGIIIKYLPHGYHRCCSETRAPWFSPRRKLHQTKLILFTIHYRSRSPEPKPQIKFTRYYTTATNCRSNNPKFDELSRSQGSVGLPF